MAAAFAATWLVVPGIAQDTRKVVEPSIPPACTTLKAKIGRAATSVAPRAHERQAAEELGQYSTSGSSA